MGINCCYISKLSYINENADIKHFQTNITQFQQYSYFISDRDLCWRQ